MSEPFPVRRRRQLDRLRMSQGKWVPKWIVLATNVPHPTNSNAGRLNRWNQIESAWVALASQTKRCSMIKKFSVAVVFAVLLGSPTFAQDAGSQKFLKEAIE